MKRLLLVALGALAAMPFLRAALPPPPEPPEAAGVLRIWGTAELKPMLDLWEKGFMKTHPAARFETRMAGTDAGIPGLYTRRADLALLGREATAPETKAFEWIFRYQPACIDVATGSLGRRGRSPALIVYVHRDNPLVQVTLAQLDAAFGCERLRGAPTNIRTWGQLGLTGTWIDRPIHLYAPDTEEGTGRFFRTVVLKDSRMLDWDHLTEFSDTKAHVAMHDAARKILTALAADPLGLAVAGAGLEDARVKPLALAESAAGPFLSPTAENLVARTYPLTRVVHAYLNRVPGAPLDAKVREFLAYVLSVDGQSEIERSRSGYLPLAPAAAQVEHRKLD